MFAVAWASTSVRGTMAIADVALVMAIVTVGVALVSWSDGLVTSVAAALSLNYFHTEPVHSLRVTDTSDLVAVVLLATLGVAVSAATAIRVRAAARDHHASAAAGVRDELVDLSPLARPVTAVWSDAVRASCAGLAMVDCRIEPSGSSLLPVVSRQRVGADETSTLVLPEGGAIVAFRDPRHASQVVLVPRAGMGSLELDRRAVFAFVDQLDLALSTTVSS